MLGPDVASGTRKAISVTIPIKALHEGQGHFRRLMEYSGRGIGNIHEQHRQFFSRGHMLMGHIVFHW